MTSLFGGSPVVNVNVSGTLVPQSFTATAGQTVFNLSGFTYTVGTNSLLVFVNGTRQILGRDFTETSSSSFTLVEGCVAGDFVDVIGFPQITLAAQQMAANISFQNSTAGALLTNVSKKLQSMAVDIVSDFGADPTGSLDISIAYQNAINSGASVITAPPGARFLIANSIVLSSGQTHIMYGVTFTGSVNMFTQTGPVSNLNFFGGTFNGVAGAGKAFYNANAAYYLNGCVFRGIAFNQSLSDCIYGTPILSTVEDCFFGTPGNIRGAQHRHLFLAGSAIAGTAVNANLFKNNRFNRATSGNPSTFIQYGSSNTFERNDWENNDGQALHVDGGGVTNLLCNWTESNGGTYQYYFECTAAITSSLYYNNCINWFGGTVNMLVAGNTAIFFLDSNSLNLNMIGGMVYTNQAGAKITVASTGNNGGINTYKGVNNYSNSFTETGLSLFSNGSNGLNLQDKGLGISLFGVQSTNGQINTGTAAASPFNNTTASASNLFVASNGVLQRSTSAKKYKTDIRDLEEIDLELFRPVRYKSLCVGDDPTKDHFGLIADEIDSAGLKELVLYGETGQVEGLQYERITVILIGALNRLKKEFEAYAKTHP
jgi:hypothetical protein